MKSLKYFSYIVVFTLVAGCSQEVIELQDPCEANPESCAPNTECEDAVAGTADFTKFVAIGNSFVAGVQAGALFNDGQSNSLPRIINKQLECAGATATFNQPNIGATLGWNLFVTQPIITPAFDPTKAVLGRLLLQYSGSASPKPTPQAYPVGVFEAVPNPSVNPSFIYGNGSTKPALNNFGVPAIVLGQALIPQTGAWAGAGTDPRFSPFYGRLAYPGTGTSTIIGDAAAAGGSFFMLWLGLDDFFLHAAFGGDPAKAPLTTGPAFTAQYGAAVGALLGSNPNLEGVVGNFPDIFVMPHFTSVTYNALPLPAETATTLTTNLANPYNQFLNAMQAAGVITAAERDSRLLTYVPGQNKILLTDETLTDLTDAMNANGAGGLVPYARARQTTMADKLPLSTGSVLGVGGAGVNVPLADQYVLIPSEITAINDARTAFNAAVQATVDANPTRLALADVNGALGALVASKGAVYNGVMITPNINPPTGIYSEDGVHPNTRGYAFLSRVFISAINAKFGSTVPLTDISLYQATALPIP